LENISRWDIHAERNSKTFFFAISINITKRTKICNTVFRKFNLKTHLYPTRFGIHIFFTTVRKFRAPLSCNKLEVSISLSCTFQDKLVLNFDWQSEIDEREIFARLSKIIVLFLLKPKFSVFPLSVDSYHNYVSHNYHFPLYRIYKTPLSGLCYKINKKK